MPINFNSDGDALVLRVIGELDWFGDLAKPIEEFKKAASSAQRIEEYVDDCYGGDSGSAFAIYEILKNHPDTTCHITGKAWSAGSLVAIGCKRILIEKDATLMIHEAAAACYGKRERLLARAEWLKELNEKMVFAYCRRTGASHEAVRKWMHFDSFFSATGAVKAGLADEVFELPRRMMGLPEIVPFPRSGEPRFDDSNLRLFWACLESIGKFETKDKAAFMRDLHAWTVYNVTQFSVADAQIADTGVSTTEESPVLAAATGA